MWQISLLSVHDSQSDLYMWSYDEQVIYIINTSRIDPDGGKWKEYTYKKLTFWRRQSCMLDGANPCLATVITEDRRYSPRYEFMCFWHFQNFSSTCGTEVCSAFVCVSPYCMLLRINDINNTVRSGSWYVAVCISCTASHWGGCEICPLDSVVLCDLWACLNVTVSYVALDQAITGTIL